MNEIFKNYRKVYKTNNTIEDNKADIDNGINNNYFINGLVNHMGIISSRNYSKLIHLQNDLLVTFFIDDNNKSFGLFFNNQEQFICPFENYINMVVNKIDPFKINVVFNYYDEDNNVQEYSFNLSSHRKYLLLNHTFNNQEELDKFEISLSAKTNETLNDIKVLLDNIHEIANDIKNSKISVKEIDYSYINNVKINRNIKKKKINKELKTYLMVTLVMVGITLIIFLLINLGVLSVINKINQ